MKVQQGRATIKMITREMQELKVLSQSKEYQESATIKSTSKKYHKQMFCQGVPKSCGSTTKTASRECYKGTSREWRNQGQSKKYQGVSQSEILPGGAIIKSTARDRHNQKYCQGVP